MFVFNPDFYLMPSYRISPFTTSDVGFNHSLPDSNFIDTYFNDRFKGGKYYFTFNGREAINLALSHYHLQKDDIITVLTTTGNFYISGCITKEIEKFCKWSRMIEPNTKIVFINHEFGYPYADLLKVKELGLPIIEDCAHSFFSHDDNKLIGTIGDFVIYSLPKMFPIQIGGILVGNSENWDSPNVRFVGNEKEMYIKNVLSFYTKKMNEIIEKRLCNYHFLSNEFALLGFTERFKLGQKIVPGVFMFTDVDNKCDLHDLKKHFLAHGIQSSVFYGESSFFIPCHQSLHIRDLEYFVDVMKSFLK